MFKRLTVSTLAVFFMFNGVICQKPEKTKSTTIKGTVVAVDTMYPLMPCYHVCMVSLIVRLENERLEQFAVVNVRHMDDRHFSKRGLHAELVEKMGRWKFTASLNEPERILLQEFRDDLIDESGNTPTHRFRGWTFLDGADSVDLPYGEVVPNYIVEVGKFKRVK